MATKLTPSEIDYAVALYTSGKTFHQVAAILGVNSSTAYVAITRRGIKPRHATADKATLDQAVSLYVGGMTGPEVRDAIGISASTLHRELRKRGIPARSRRANIPPAEVVSAYLAGESQLSLATRYRTSRPVIRRILAEQGIQPRDRSEVTTLAMAALTDEQRTNMVKKAHAAVRGRDVSMEERILRSQKRERTQSHATDRERQFGRHIDFPDVIPQKAIGPYNVDFAVGSVAVEILGGTWHAYKAEHAQRTPYILDQGWNMLFIWDRQQAPLCIEAAEYVVAFAQESSRQPALHREYRVIRGDAKLVACGSAQDDQFPLIIPSIANFRGRPIN